MFNQLNKELLYFIFEQKNCLLQYVPNIIFRNVNYYEFKII